MAYMDFPDSLKGQKERKAFWLSENGLALIAAWRRNGVALTTIATENIGVSKTAWWGWYKESEELRKVCNVSREVADSSVENALLKKACGYDYWEEIWELIEGEMIMTKKMKKHMPPDYKCIMQWLYNRMPTKWRAMQEPLEATQYDQTVKEILIAIREVAETGQENTIEVENLAEVQE